jgi:hypothetical protein
LKETITKLSNKLKEQSQKNTVLEDGIKQLKKDFDLMATQMADLRKDLRKEKEKNEIQDEKIRVLEGQHKFCNEHKS